MEQSFFCCYSSSWLAFPLIKDSPPAVAYPSSSYRTHITFLSLLVLLPLFRKFLNTPFQETFSFFSYQGGQSTFTFSLSLDLELLYFSHPRGVNSRNTLPVSKNKAKKRDLTWVFPKRILFALSFDSDEYSFYRRPCFIIKSKRMCNFAPD